MENEQGKITGQNVCGEKTGGASAAKEKKGLWKRIMEKLDQAMVKKAKQSPCCGKKPGDKKCC
ncbi:MAG: hypothetical protein ABII74_03665 [Elusimicrobiota bacterium]